MPQSTYISETDPSGALLPDINEVLYTNFDLSYIPQYGDTYLLKDYQSNVVSDYFRPYTGDGSLEWPAPLAFDASNNLYVCTIALANFISRVDGEFITNVFPLNTDTPSGIAFDKDNILYITIANSNVSFERQEFIWPQVWTSKILKLDLITLNAVELVVSGISTNKLDGICFDNSGNLFVSDSITSTIFKITETGYSTGVGEIFASNLAGINTPIGLAADLYNNIYVCNSGNNNLVRITPQGMLTVVASTGLDNPTGVTYNPINNCLYVANYGPLLTNVMIPAKVFVYQIVNETLFQLPIPYPADINYREWYYAIATDKTGKVYTCGAEEKPNIFFQQGQGAFIKEIKDMFTGTKSVGLFYGGEADVNAVKYPIVYNINPITSIAIDSTQTNLYCSQFTSPFKPDSVDPVYVPYPYGVIWKVPLTDPSFNPVLVYPSFVDSNNFTQPKTVAVKNNGVVYSFTGDAFAGHTLFGMNPEGVIKYVGFVNKPEMSNPSSLIFDNQNRMLYCNSTYPFVTGAINSPLVRLTFVNDYTTTAEYINLTGFSLADLDGMDQIALNSDSTILYFRINGTTNKQIWKYVFATGASTKLLDLAVSAVYSFGGGGGVKVDSSGNVYTMLMVTATAQGSLVYWDNSDTLNTVSVTFNDGSSYPLGVVFGFSEFTTGGALYVNTLSEIAIERTLYLYTFSSSNTAIASTSTITGQPITDTVNIALNPAQTDVFLADSGTNQILKYNIATEVASDFVVFVTGYVTPILNNPTSVIFEDSSTTHLYVGNSIANNIVRVGLDGLAEDVTVTGVTLSGPTGFSYDNTGNLYVVNFNSNTLCKLTFADPLNAVGVAITITGSPLFQPSSTSFDDTFTKLYVSNSGLDNVVEVNVATGASTLYSNGGKNISEPGGIAFDNETGQLYITSSGTNELVQISNNNQLNNVVVDVVSDDSLLTPQGITIDASYNIYLANYGNAGSPILKITHDISFNNIYDSSTDGIRRPRQCVAYEPTKSIYIADSHAYIPLLDNTQTVTKYATNPLLDRIGGSVAIRNKPPTLTTGPFIVAAADFFFPPNAYFVSITPDQTNPETGTPVVNDVIVSGDSDIGNEMPVAIFDEASNPTSKLYAGLKGIPDPSDPFQTLGGGIIEVTFTSEIAAVSKILNITGLQLLYNKPAPITAIAFSNDHTFMYTMTGGEAVPTTAVAQLELKRIANYRTNSVLVAETFVTFPSNDVLPGPVRPYTSLVVDKYDYIYALVRSRYYRITPSGDFITFIDPLLSDPVNLLWNGTYMNYVPWDNSIFVSVTRVNSTDKIFLSFKFDNMDGRVEPYNDTMYIYDISGSVPPFTETYDFSYNIYDKYIVIDPSNIDPGVATDTTFHFVMPNVLPEPTDVYTLTCNSVAISDDFCNNCTYNKTKFQSGTYPTSVAYTDNTNYLYVSLQNNTISRINLLGVVENDIVSSTDGLNGPVSMVVDLSYNLFVLNRTGGFISKLILTDNIFQIDNTFYTGITNAIDFAFDQYGGEYIYILSGSSPSVIITRISAVDGSGAYLVPVPFGTIYDPNGLSIDEFKPGERFLYVSDTDQTGVNRIMKINLLDGLYTSSTVISGLVEKPFKIANKHDGFLYVCNREGDSIAKISIDAQWNNINNDVWAVANISVPSGLAFDASGNMYVANTGTSPRNSRVSKIYMEYFPFTNVILNNGTCDTTQIYNRTTKTYVVVNYDTSNPTMFPIPFPYPIVD